jgi:hypothetical protein
MKRAIVLALSLGVASPAWADPVNPGTQCIETPANAEGFVLAREIVEVVLPANSAEAVMHQMMSALGQQLKSSMPGKIDDPAIKAIVDRRIAEVPDRMMPAVRRFLPVQKAAMACAYTHTFSLTELREVRSFAATPAGSRYLSLSASLMSDPAVAEANQSFFRDIQPIQEQMVRDVVDDMMAYYASKAPPPKP